VRNKPFYARAKPSGRQVLWRRKFIGRAMRRAGRPLVTSACGSATLTSEEIIDEAFAKGGVAINFRAPFDEERVQEAGK